ncbi:hypothetical protein M408DRAFT_28948 [Serendipita vermifera MAFF 305830]|uniref:F-box domain-containing protein n=1 Tax=Serendipita vermifera MAFF 305830 TaxID=933852 RepID=A0A0C3AQ22_SERVB|nr:hypothetical protein M408DRAFT_28948 [Serendipita vermifera MAFF 305830]
MSVEEASEEFCKIMKHVYIPSKLLAENRIQVLRECFEDVMKKKGFPTDLQLETNDQEGCASFVVTSRHANVNNAICFRSYPVGSQPSSITVVDAVLATCATQPEFAPVSLISGSRAEYIASREAANPIHEVIKEALVLFGGDATVSSLLSLGTGNTGVIPLSPTDTTLYDYERRAQETELSIGQLGVYSRFSVEHGLQDVHAGNFNDMEWITAQTGAYLDDYENSERLDLYIQNCVSQTGSITLAQLDEVTAVDQWFARHPRQTISLINDIPYYAQQTNAISSLYPESVPLLDPSSVLPYEIWIKCVSFVIQDVPTGPLELLTVSKSWYTLFINSPLLWTDVFLENSEDELARVWTFLHLSRDSPLHIHIRTMIPSNESLELLYPHRPRIKVISIMPGYHIEIPTSPTYWGQWRRSTSYILMTFFDDLTPSDVEHTYAGSLRGPQGEYYVSFIQLNIKYPPAKRVLTRRQLRNRIDERTEKNKLLLRWEQHIHSAIQDVLPTGFSMSLSVEERPSPRSRSWKCSYVLRRHVGLDTDTTTVEGAWSSSESNAIKLAAREAMGVLQRWNYVHQCSSLDDVSHCQFF